MDKIHYKNIKKLIDNGDIDNFKEYIISMKIDINENFSPHPRIPESMIYYAVKKSQIAIIDYLMSQDSIVIDRKNSEGLTALMHAITYKKEVIFDKLMEHPHPGLQIGGENNEDRLYPMTRAAQARSIHMLKKIANHRENDWDLLGNTPLFYACSNRQTKMALYIINHPQFLPHRDVGGRHALNFIADNKKLVDALLALKSVNPNACVRKKNAYKEVDSPIWWENFRFLNGGKFGSKFGSILEKNILNHPDVDCNAKDSVGMSLIEYYAYPSNYGTFEVLVRNKNTDIHQNIDNSNSHTLLEKIVTNKNTTDYEIEKNDEMLGLLLGRIIKEKKFIDQYVHKLEAIHMSEDNGLKNIALASLRHIQLGEKVLHKENAKPRINKI